MVDVVSRIKLLFTAEGAKKATKETEQVGRAQTRLGQASASAGRQFSSQASGLGGLVTAYAGAAANVFALTMAFSALQRAAQAETIIRGTENLAAAVGVSGRQVIASLKDVTGAQLSFVDAAEKANLALASGFNAKQIQDLGEISLKASRALGRNLGDAFERLVRGSAKLEPELLDELGIFTRIEPAVERYAMSLNKSASSLTQFQRRQAFVNAVIEEGERKFKAIDTSVPSAQEAIERLSASFKDLVTDVGVGLANVLAPVAEFFAGSFGNQIAAFGLIVGQVGRVAVRELSAKLEGLADRADNVSRKFGDLATRFGRSKQAISETQQAMEGLNKSSVKTAIALGTQTKGLITLAQEGRITGGQLKDLEAGLRAQAAAKLEDASAEKARSARAKEAQKAFDGEKKIGKTRFSSLKNAQKATEAAAKSSERLANESKDLTKRADDVAAAMSKQSKVVGVASKGMKILAGSVRIAARAFNFLFKSIFFIIQIYSALQILGSIFSEITGLANPFEKAITGLRDKFRSLTRATDQLEVGLRGVMAVTSGDQLGKIFKDLGLNAAQAAKATTNAMKTVMGSITEVRNTIQGQQSGFAMEEGDSWIADQLGLGGSGFQRMAGNIVGFTKRFFNSESGAKALGAAMQDTDRITVSLDAAIVQLTKDLEDQEKKTGPNFSQDKVNMLAAQKQAVEAIVEVIKDYGAEGFALTQTIGALAQATGETGETIAELTAFAQRGVLALSKAGNASTEFEVKVRGLQIATFDLNTASFNVAKTLTGRAVPAFVKLTAHLNRVNRGMEDTSISSKELVARANALSNAEQGLVDALESEANMIETIKRLSGPGGLSDEQQRRIEAAEKIIAAIQVQLTNIKGLKKGTEEYTDALAAQNTMFDRMYKKFSSFSKSAEDLDLSGFLGSTAGGDAFDRMITQMRSGAKKQVPTMGFDIDNAQKFANQLENVSIKYQAAAEANAKLKEFTGVHGKTVGEIVTKLQEAGSDTEKWSSETRKLMFDSGVITERFGDITTSAKEIGIAVQTIAEHEKRRVSFQNILVGMSEKFFQSARKIVEANEKTDRQMKQRLAMSKLEVSLAQAQAKAVTDAATSKANIALEQVKLTLLEKQLEVRKADLDQQMRSMKNDEERLKRLATTLKLEKELLAVQSEGRVINLERGRQAALGGVAREAQFGEAYGGLVTEAQTLALRQKAAKIDYTYALAIIAEEKKNIEDQYRKQRIILQGQKTIATSERDRLVKQQTNQADLIIKEDALLKARRVLEENQDKSQKSRLNNQIAVATAQKAVNLQRIEDNKVNRLADLKLQQERSKGLLRQAKIFKDFTLKLGLIMREAVEALLRGQGKTEPQVQAALKDFPTASELTGDMDTLISDLVKYSNDTYWAGLKKLAEDTAAETTQKVSAASDARIAAANTELTSIKNVADQRQLVREEEDRITQMSREEKAEELKNKILLLNKEIENFATREALLNTQEENELNRLLQRQEAATRAYEAEILAIQYLQDQWNNVLDNFSSKLEGRVTGAINDFFTAIQEGTLTLATFKEGFKQFVVGILGDLSQAIIDEFVTKPLTDLIKSGIGSLANQAGPAVSGATTAATTTASATAMATALTTAGTLVVGAITTTGTALTTGLTTFSTTVVTTIATIGATLGASITTLGATLMAAAAAAAAQITMAKAMVMVANVGGSVRHGGMAMQPAGFASGGGVQRFAAGGATTVQRDRIPALLEPGEFVIRKPAAKAIGGPALQRLNAHGQTPPGNVSVNVTNKGTPQQVQSAQPRIDVKGMVVDIVMKDLSNNGPIKQGLRGGGSR